MLKKLLFILIIFQVSLAAYISYSSAIVPTPQIWSDGDTIGILGNVEFSSSVIANGSIQVVIQTNSTLKFSGSVTLNGTSVGSPIEFIVDVPETEYYQEIKIKNASNAYLKNVSIQRGQTGLVIDQSSQTILDNVTILNCRQYDLKSVYATPTIIRSSFGDCNVHPVQFIVHSPATQADYPKMFQCNIGMGTATGENLAYITDDSFVGSTFLEGNYWSGGTPVIGVYNATSLTIDSNPRLGSNPFVDGTESDPVEIRGGAGAVGQIDSDFYLFSDLYYEIINGDISVANGATLYIGISNNINNISYYGGTKLQLSDPTFDIVFSSGSCLKSPGITSNPNIVQSGIAKQPGMWGGITLQSGSSATINNTFINNGTLGLDITTNALDMNYVTFNANTTGMRIGNVTIPQISNVAFTGNNYGLNVNGYGNIIDGLTFATSLYNNIEVNLSAPEIRNCTIQGGQKGIELNSGGDIHDNNISN